MRRAFVGFLILIVSFIFLSCVGKKPRTEPKNTYYYGVIPVIVSEDFIKTLSEKTSFFGYNQKLEFLANKIYYYYYYYLFHPKVIAALSSGDNKIRNLPVKLKVKNEIIKTKIDIEYPDYLKEAFVNCKNQGGTVKVQIKIVHSDNPIHNRTFLNEYKFLIRKDSKSFALYPTFVCVRNSEVLSRYVVFPMRRIRKLSRYATERFTSDYPKSCLKKIENYSLNPMGVSKFISDKITDILRDGRPIYTKYCIHKMYSPHNICSGAGVISGIGVKAIYDTYLAKDGFWDCGVDNNPVHLRGRVICEIDNKLAHCKNIKKFCEMRR